jgi:hypothetical protein
VGRVAVSENRTEGLYSVTVAWDQESSQKSIDAIDAEIEMIDGAIGEIDELMGIFDSQIAAAKQDYDQKRSAWLAAVREVG